MAQARRSGGSGSSSGTGSRSGGAKRASSSSRSGSSARKSASSRSGSRSSTSGRSTSSARGQSKRSAQSSATSAASAAAAAVDPAVEAAAQRLRKLNERIIEAGRNAGEGALSSYERALKTIAGTLERGPGSSDVEWISALATAQAKFIRDVTAAWTKAARDMIK
jgi:hypothetical protein